MSTTWTLAQIRQKVRQVTGRLSPNELTNSQLDTYINQYYQYTFPAEVKLDRKYTYYTFNTVNNQQTYSYSTSHTNYVPDATIDNFTLQWYQNPTIFNAQNYEQVNRLTPWAVPVSTSISGFTNSNPGIITVASTSGFVAGNTILTTGISETGGGTSLNNTFTIASTGSSILTLNENTSAYATYVSGGLVTLVITQYSTTLSGTPIKPGSVIVSDNVETFIDDGAGALTGDLGGTGTINYTTGALLVNFNSTPGSDGDIEVSYISYTVGRPTAVLAFNNQFTFYPVPNQVYRFQVQAYKIVDPLVNATDTPDLNEWGPGIAYGASRDIHADFGEMDAYAQVSQLYKEQLGYILTRTNQNLLNTRAEPNF